MRLRMETKRVIAKGIFVAADAAILAVVGMMLFYFTTPMLILFGVSAAFFAVVWAAKTLKE